jgi:hypothetical protein
MSKTRDTGFLGNVIKVDASGNVSFVSGSTTLATINTSGQLSGSSPVLSSSYALNADLLDGLDSTQFTLTSSFAAQTASFTAFTASVNSFTASQLVLNGTYATTGSNTFKNPQTINSNLIVTGSITAQTLVVSTINATQSYSSGSNIFGNNISNTQTFTGSLLVTGSSTFNGALTAGATTLNGNLQFASGYFVNMPWESDTRTVWERYTNATYFQRISSNGTARQLRIESNGAYGNASIVLDGQGNTTTSTIITSDNSIFTGTVSLNTGNNIRLYRPDSSFPSTSWYWNINMTSGNLLSFAINSGTAKMVIDASGYVGIGVTNPITKLSVAGSIAMGNNTDGITNLSYGGKISAKQTTVTGGAGATLVHRGLGSVGYFILVSGIGGPSSTYRFTDLIYGTGTNTPSVLASSTVGSAPTRTYSMSGENVAVSLSGGDTYTVTTTGLGAMES